MKVVLEKQENEHEGFGRPVFKAWFSETVRCHSCSKDLQEGSNCFVGRAVAGVWCKECGPENNSSDGNRSFSPNGERRVATHVEVAYRDDEVSREEVREDLLEKYESNDYEIPSDDQLSDMVDKRLSQKEDYQSGFFDDGKSLGDLVES